MRWHIGWAMRPEITFLMYPVKIENNRQESNPGWVKLWRESIQFPMWPSWLFSFRLSFIYVFLNSFCWSYPTTLKSIPLELPWKSASFEYKISFKNQKGIKGDSRLCYYKVYLSTGCLSHLFARTSSLWSKVRLNLLPSLGSRCKKGQ